MAENVGSASNQGASGLKALGLETDAKTTFVHCISCTRVIMVTRDSQCSFSVLPWSVRNAEHTCINTHCQSCSKNGERAWNESVESVQDKCVASFQQLRLSPLLLSQSRPFSIMKTIAGEDIQIQDDGKLLYASIRDIRARTANDFKVLGVRTDGGAGSDPVACVMPYLPGGFL